MITSRINFSSLVFVCSFIIFYVHQGSTLQCYHCSSLSNETCGKEPKQTHLVTCEEETATENPPTISSTAESSTTPASTSPTTSGSAATTASGSAATTASGSAATTASGSAATTASGSAATTASGFAATSASTETSPAGDSWECVKLLGEEGGAETVTRKCAKKNESFCNGKATNTCFVCDTDGCNSAPSIGIQLISMILPLATALFLAR